MTEYLNIRLQKALSFSKMTQKQLAQKVGITEASISHYLKGDRSPRASVVAKIAEALNCNVEFLLGTSDINEKNEFDNLYRMMARNVNQLTTNEKMQLMKILFKEG